MIILIENNADDIAKIDEYECDKKLKSIGKNERYTEQFFIIFDLFYIIL